MLTRIIASEAASVAPAKRPAAAWRGMAGAGIAALAVAAGAIAVAAAPVKESAPAGAPAIPRTSIEQRLSPSPRIAPQVPAATSPATTRTSVPLAPSSQVPVLPKRSVRAALRAAQPAVAPVKDPLNPVEKVPVPLMTGAPALPRREFESGARFVPQPPPAVVTRIPNLVTSPRKAALAVHPLGAPALPVPTPPVNNVDGTTALNLIPPMTRQIMVEVAAPPSVLPVEQEPFVQAPGAPDDVDAPVPTTGPVTRVKIE